MDNLVDNVTLNDPRVKIRVRVNMTPDDPGVKFGVRVKNGQNIAKP